MPKVTRKETAAAAAQPLQEASTSGMEIEAGEEQLPPKPSFGELSAQDQAGAKVEFRRVSGRHTHFAPQQRPPAPQTRVRAARRRRRA